jgi:phage terminase large subunit-like protein
MGQPFLLRSWQKKVIQGIYGSPTRRAIISFGRKNGKTSFAAVLLLLHLCGIEARYNSELYSSALSRDQASILFRLAAKIVRLSSTMRGEVDIRETVKQLYCPHFSTLYTALSADASTNFGLSPVFIVHDELGQVSGPRHSLYEALETATGAQEAPLSIVISTQAPNDADLLSVLIDDAKTDIDPRTKVFLFTAPKEDDPFAKKTIKKANPALDQFQNTQEVLDMAEAARRMPSREAEYRNLVLNQRVETANPFVSLQVWAENGDDPDDLGEIYAGLDLSAANDLTALVMVSPKGKKLDVECAFWLPSEGLKERALRDRALYDVWYGQGFIKTTPGRSIQYEYVADYIARLLSQRDVRAIAFDRWNMRYFRPWLVKAGLTESLIDSKFHDFGQGWVSMSPALRTLEEQLLEKRIRHGNHPVLKMCAANAVVHLDARANRTLDKKRSRGRIDGMVALAMATSLAVAKSHEKHVYNQVPIDRILETV